MTFKLAKCSNITEEWWYDRSCTGNSNESTCTVWLIALRKTTVVSSCWILASCDTTCVMMFCFAAPDILQQRRRNQYGTWTWCSRDFWSLSLSLSMSQYVVCCCFPTSKLESCHGTCPYTCIVYHEFASTAKCFKKLCLQFERLPAMALNTTSLRVLDAKQINLSSKWGLFKAIISLK